LLAYFRSQHTNQSWLSALTTLLDASALVDAMSGDESCGRQARLTFAMARHAVVDLSQVFSTPPRPPAQDRLPPRAFQELVAALATAGIVVRQDPRVIARLDELRRLYDPYVTALSTHLLQTLPVWHDQQPTRDNWQRSAWDRQALGVSHASDQPAQPSHAERTSR
jgi:hypothetical protein